MARNGDSFSVTGEKVFSPPSLRAIRDFCARFCKTGSLADEERCGWPSRLKKFHLDYVSTRIRKKLDVTVKELVADFSRLFFAISRSTMQRIIRKVHVCDVWDQQPETFQEDEEDQED